MSAIVLAAGLSRRFGDDPPKQLARFGGETLVRRAAETALASRCTEVVVVLGHRAEEVGESLAGLPVRTVVNPEHAAGQSTSVAAGLAALGGDVSAALLLPVDQPLLTPAVLDSLVAAWRERRGSGKHRGGGPVVRPTYRGRPGAPVLFDRSLFPELAAVTGDTGGRQVIARRPEAVVEVELATGGPLVDVDDPEALARLV